MSVAHSASGASAAEPFDPRHAERIARAFELRTPPEPFRDDPYPYYAALRTHDPVRTMGDGSVFLTRYDDVSAVYRSASASSDKKVEFAPKFGDSPLYEHHTTSLVFNDPPLHTRVRRLILGALSQRAVSRMEAGVVQLVDRLLDAMQEKERVDLIDDFAAAIPVEVIGNLLAVPREARGPLRNWSLAILGALEPVPTDAMLERGNRSVREFGAFLDELIGDRRAHPLDPEEDVLTRLIRGEGDGERLMQRELVHNCIFLLNAGHETTTNLIGNGMDALLRHPDSLQRLRDDASLVNSAIEEMLRYESPLQLNNRRLVGEVELSDRTLAAGTFVTLCIGAANRDPTRFPEPDRFDVARKPNRHFAFGHGDHACAGMSVARLEGRIAVGRLLARFPVIERDGEPERDRRIRFRGFRHLPARVRAA
ncbi:MAG: cytochrome P450 [Burkholderiaceae bacterium]|jgi:cytochrome P450|nr:cytochrome P450 [Burkholderiaceae bacterium]